MSEPKRYSVIVNADSVEQVESDNGGFVLYDDYAILKADLEKSDEVVYILAVENERLKAELDKYRKDVTNSVDDLLDERKSLKAEVERLKAFTTRTIIPNEELQAENARLKAKVSDLECDAETHYRQGMDDEYEIEWLNKITHGLMKEKEQLQAQVERLTKAGDAMADYIMVVPGTPMAHVYLIDWNAAKDGKSQP